MNKWKIPDWLENEVRDRDQNCVYCGVLMIEKMPKKGPRKTIATWEHIINDAEIINRDNIALCCVACNASKGAKILCDWIHSEYCRKKNITQETVADIIKQALRKGEMS